MDCSPPDFPVLHSLPGFAQTHVHWISDATQPPHSLLPPSPPICLSQHQGLFQWVGSSHPVDKVLELQHQSFQWIFRMNNGIVTCIIIRESSFALFFITKAWLHSLSHLCFRWAFSALVEASGAGYSGWWNPLVRGTVSVLFFQLERRLRVAEWEAFLIVLGKFSKYSISLWCARLLEHKLMVTELVDLIAKPPRNWCTVSCVISEFRADLFSEMFWWGRIFIDDSKSCQSCQECRWVYLLMIFIKLWSGKFFCFLREKPHRTTVSIATGKSGCFNWPAQEWLVDSFTKVKGSQKEKALRDGCSRS